jgi:hypothetical protein
LRQELVIQGHRHSLWGVSAMRRRVAEASIEGSVLMAKLARTLQMG